MSITKSVAPGQRFSRWLAISECARRGRAKYWICRCNCGNLVEVAQSSLVYGKTHGCRKCARIGDGRSSTRAGVSWVAMMDRCYRESHVHYASYGGAGISVCDEWHEFSSFYADMGERPEGTTLDRIDGGKGYSKDNCRWATPREQANNRKTTRRIQFDGATYSLTSLAIKLGIKITTARKRLDEGRDVVTGKRNG